MSAYRMTACPACGAGNRPGAPSCAACGRALRLPGFAAARPVDDEDDDEPRRPARSPADAVQKGSPKRPARPVDDDLDDEDERPSKRSIRREDVDDDEPSIRDNAILNLFFPVGVSIWALGSNYLGVLGLLAVVFGFVGAGASGIKILGLVLPILGGLMGLLAIPLGAMAFIVRPKKATYGGMTSYLRAVIGILLGLAALVGAPAAIWVSSSM